MQQSVQLLVPRAGPAGRPRAAPDPALFPPEAGALGVRLAHGGTVAGFLPEPGRGAAGRTGRARAGLGRLETHRSRELHPPIAPQPEDAP